MKITSTAPDLCTLDTNGIKDLKSVNNIPMHLRLVQLSGVPIRLEINPDGYVELKSAEEEIDISKYYDSIKEVSKFFYGKAYLYGFVNEDELSIYDIYTNDNFLSTRDMAQLETKYRIPIVKSIVEGKLTFNSLVEILDKKVNDEKIKYEELHILPCMYLNDSRSDVKPSVKITSKIIIGEKKEKVYPVWSGTNTNIQSLKTVSETKKVEKIIPLVFKQTTKEERENIFKETYKNVSDYFEKIKPTLDLETIKWWEKYGKFIAHVYAIHTLPPTRKIVYDYATLYSLPYICFHAPVEEKWANLFFDLFEDYYYDNILYKKYEPNLEDVEHFSKIFKEELLTFDKFFEKETNKKDDWRTGENLGSMYSTMWEDYL